MYRYFFIAKNNMKKQKKDMITFFVMTFISAVLIYLSVTMLIGADRVLKDVDKKINGADIFVITYGGYDSDVNTFKLEDMMRSNKSIGKYETRDFSNASSAKYRHKGDKKWTDYAFYFCVSDDNRTIQSTSIDVSGLKDNEIILPIAMSTSFSLGETIEIKIEDYIYSYKIVGFNEDTYFCSPMNMGVYLAFITSQARDNMQFDLPDTIFIKGKMILAKLSDTARKKNTDVNALCDRFTSDYLLWRSEYMASHPDASLGGYNFLPRQMMYSASLILPYMFVAMVLLFAFIILAISLVIIDFSVKNFIMTNMKNTAIMEASGYTVNELVLILLTQLLIVAGMGSLMGVIVGASVAGKVGYVLLFLLGLKWNQPVYVNIALLVVLAICLIVAILTVILGKDYKKTSVLEALRGGINSHNFKKNLFSFDKTFFPVPITLALKETFGRFRSQIGVIFIAMVLTISSAIGMGMVDTFASSSDAVMNIAGMVFEDAQSDLEDESMLDNINNMSTVEYAYGDVWFEAEYSKGKRKQNVTTRAFTDTSHIVGGGLYDGRWPKHNNEIMLAANAANTFGVEVGDTITIRYGANEESYIVCGLNQTFNNLGNMGFMTIDGVKRIASAVTPSLAEIKIKDRYTYQDFEKEFKETYPEVDVVSVDDSVASIANLIIASCKVVAIFVAVLTCLIIAFVESLIVRTQIIREWRNLGVSKALGFTSNQLIFQTTLSNLPGIGIGIILGLLFGSAAGEKGCALMFSIFGYKKVEFMISPTSYILTVILIVSIAMITSAFIGRRIKTLEPVKMITEE
ncbi:MAG: FtsX-like permease family protein [Lachnospiraceae bacterium]|nr:FtsX-like permease family protein [Lachnospiraceae bacterium]